MLPKQKATAQRVRSALRKKLEDEDEDDLAAKLGKCGESVRLVCVSCGHLHDVESRCDLRWCPCCAPALAHAAVERYARITPLIRWPLNVTVTCKNYDYAEGAAAVRHFRRGVAKMRALRWHRRIVRGGVTGVELTDGGNGFHVHSHSVLDCEWFAKSVIRPTDYELRACSPEERAELWHVVGLASTDEIADAFTRTLGRPASVHVRRSWSRDKGDLSRALAEAMKYAVKAGDLCKCSHAGRVIHAIEGTRLRTAFGHLYRRPEFRVVKPPARPCAECGALGTICPASVMDREFRASRLSRDRRR